MAELARLEATFIEDYSRLQQQLLELQTKLEQAVPEATSSVASQADMQALERKLQETESRAVRIGVERDRLQAQLQQVESDALRVRDSKRELEVTNDQLQRELQALESVLLQTKTQLERMTQDRQRINEEFLDVVSKHAQLQRALGEASKELEQRHRSVGTDLEQLKLLQAENPRLKSDLEKCRQKAQEYFKKMQLLQQQFAPPKPR